MSVVIRGIDQVVGIGLPEDSELQDRPGFQLASRNEIAAEREWAVAQYVGLALVRRYANAGGDLEPVEQFVVGLDYAGELLIDPAELRIEEPVGWQGIVCPPPFRRGGVPN
ncbi:hypothetical protein [Sphingobium sp. C100]|uniref:hypothetical protein n=1 Tax=Sphingobium sp. C100 TaxID=1207055 RepID=UPI0012695AE6|nr:hypothetical protein [Sphingobium sp. C100]